MEELSVMMVRKVALDPHVVPEQPEARGLTVSAWDSRVP